MNFFRVHSLFPGDLVSVSEIQEAAHKPAQELQETRATCLPGSSSSPRVHPSSASFAVTLQTQCGQSQCQGRSNTALDDHVLFSPEARSGRKKGTTGEVFSLFCTGQEQQGLHRSVTIISWVGRRRERLVGWHTQFILTAGSNTPALEASNLKGLKSNGAHLKNEN